MQWERVSETQRIEKIREYRDSPWSPSKAKRQPGFDQSQVFHPSTLGRGQARSLRQAPGSSTHRPATVGSTSPPAAACDLSRKF